MLIPRIFHVIWLGDKQVPNEFNLYRRTWKTLHPGWQFKIWNDDNLPCLLNQRLFDETRYNSHVVKCADILRLDLIVQFGGVYIDMDFECFKCIEPLIDNLDGFSAGEEPHLFCNSIMGCVPGHPGFTRFLEVMPDWVSEHYNEPISMQTGPNFYTRVRKLYPELQSIAVFPPKYFYPYLYYEKHRKGEHFPEAYAAHHWAGSWIE